MTATTLWWLSESLGLQEIDFKDFATLYCGFDKNLNKIIN